MDSQQTIEHIVGRLQVIPGIAAIVLGGSRATGTHTPESDIDIGIYYKPEALIDIAAVEKAAETLDDLRRCGLITPIGEWGPWINGGGWLKVDGVPVDFLYRDLTKVAETIEDCIQGRVTMDYQPGHPHGFTNSIYMGEIAACVPLWDPEGIVAALKMKTQKYPAKLKQATISKFLWEADFSAVGAEKGVSRRDVTYAAGHLFRAISCLTQALFALNETYLLNEKGAVANINNFAAKPARFEQRVQQAFSGLSAEQADLLKAIQMVKALVEETQELVRQA